MSEIVHVHVIIPQGEIKVYDWTATCMKEGSRDRSGMTQYVRAEDLEKIIESMAQKLAEDTILMEDLITVWGLMRQRAVTHPTASAPEDIMRAFHNAIVSIEKYLLLREQEFTTPPDAAQPKGN